MTSARFDFHIHTRHMGCANATMEVAAIIKECERVGAEAVAMTDHFYTHDDLVRHDAIRRDIERLDTRLPVFFGLELNYCGRDVALPFDPEVRERHGFQFAIGGVHGSKASEYDLARIIETHHRMHLEMCADPLIDVIAHTYSLNWGEFQKKGWPWFDSMKAVPESFVRELGQAARETGTTIEINATATIASPHHSERYALEYAGFLSVLAEEGVLFSPGSDAHDIGSLAAVSAAWDVIARLGIPADRVWRPRCDPIAGAV